MHGLMFVQTAHVVLMQLCRWLSWIKALLARHLLACICHAMHAVKAMHATKAQNNPLGLGEGDLGEGEPGLCVGDAGEGL